jgi:hypothetical protein
VAAVMARNPLAIHCAALIASAVREESVPPSWISPAMKAPTTYAIAGAGMIRYTAPGRTASEAAIAPIRTQKPSTKPGSLPVTIVVTIPIAAVAITTTIPRPAGNPPHRGDRSAGGGWP